jgi:hypothetical protein
LSAAKPGHLASVTVLGRLIRWIVIGWNANRAGCASAEPQLIATTATIAASSNARPGHVTRPPSPDWPVALGRVSFP